MELFSFYETTSGAFIGSFHFGHIRGARAAAPAGCAAVPGFFTRLQRFDAASGKAVPADVGDVDRQATADGDMHVARDTTLHATDWTVGMEAPLNREQRESWCAFRRALRALPATMGWATGSPAWPAIPE